MLTHTVTCDVSRETSSRDDAISNLIGAVGGATSAIAEMERFLWLLLLLLHGWSHCRQPNIVFLLTDDQDLMLGGNTPMPFTRGLMATAGANLTNFFVNTPVCCPSRATILTGRYPHNWLTPSGGCMHMNVTSPAFQQSTIGLQMQALGYTTGLFGKMVNPEGMDPYCKGPTPQLLPGFDHFLAMCNDNMYFKNEFTLDGHLFTSGETPEDYLTSLIGNHTIDFVTEALKEDRPFFAYVAPHAPHVPATPAPWYAAKFTGLKAPRTPNYNYSAFDHHYVVRSQPGLDSTVEKEVDQLFENRWRTLLSVDDIVSALVPLLTEHRALENTYIVHTSDHGFQLGQFRLPSCKLQPYDHDIRVPFSIFGPGIQAGVTFDFVAGMVDVAPTLVTLAGGSPTPAMDGKSFAELLLGMSSSAIRQKHMIEYWTLGEVVRYGHYIDLPNNTFIGVRLLNSTHNYMYAEFYKGVVENFTSPLEYELFDVGADPYQIVNLYGSSEENKQLVAELREFVHSEVKCSGQPGCQ